MKPTSKLSFKIVAALFKGLFKIMVRWEIKGRENLPPNGPVIAVCNHFHIMDPVFHIISILPRDSIFMAKEELFHYWPVPLFRILMNIAEAFPVRRRGTPEERQEALRWAEKVLGEGLVLGMYPEGTRSRSGQLREAYHGTAIVALRSGAPLIAVGIWGTEKLKGSGWLHRPKVIVSFGQPFTLSPLEGELTSGHLKSLTYFIMKQLAAVLPPEYQGEYSG